jgi:hypothetical protein
MGVQWHNGERVDGLSDQKRPGRRRRLATLAATLTMLPAAAVIPDQTLTPASVKTVVAPAPAVRHKRPNVLIIVADDLGFGDVGFNGASFATPNIDRIAKSGFVLDRFYTSPICSPTRAGLAHRPA